MSRNSKDVLVVVKLWHQL